MTTAINADRGEVGITLGGHVYPMLPTVEATNAIESEIGSVYWLSQRIILGQYFPTFREIGIVAAECIRAAGKDRGDSMLKVSTEKITEMVFEEGLNDDNVVKPLIAVLANMVGGGTKKKAPSGSPPPSEQIESPTGS
jgi:hypothetical protein